MRFVKSRPSLRWSGWVFSLSLSGSSRLDPLQDLKLSGSSRLDLLQDLKLSAGWIRSSRSRGGGLRPRSSALAQATDQLNCSFVSGGLNGVLVQPPRLHREFTKGGCEMETGLFCPEQVNQLLWDRVVGV